MIVTNVNTSLSKSKAFLEICRDAAKCRICSDLADKTAVLSELNGNLNPKVMFIGEAPGRVGADRTRRLWWPADGGLTTGGTTISYGLRGRIALALTKRTLPRRMSADPVAEMGLKKGDTAAALIKSTEVMIVRP